ncbi:MAG TPA: FkbM family methyltransferase [Candidatus Methylomirabilis sp.]|nr:FkbM family methyltransferase [Candidatus Methylomirabilis sp.]
MGAIIETTPDFSSRLARFLAKPLREKRRVLANRVRQFRDTLGVPSIKRIEPGFLYIAWNDDIRQQILDGTFEFVERKFVQRFLKSGMTVLDIGAYYGLYSILASLGVGQLGRVIAFEPSPDQRKRLALHLRINRLKNVHVESVALGSCEGEQTLFSVPGGSAGFSSLRCPVVEDAVRPISVHVTTLDAYLQQNCIKSVDLIKIDVEGGELDVFRGAQNLLRQSLRPVILCELEDIRTKVWGHCARDTSAFIEAFGFHWFSPRSDGTLAAPLHIPEEEKRNLIAIPAERMDSLKEMIRNGPDV